MKKIYIDFDHTLYSTTSLKYLIKLMVYDNINRDIDKIIIIDDINILFNTSKTISEFCEKIDRKCKNNKNFKEKILKYISESNLIYSDSIEFLKQLKDFGFEINILTYSNSKDFEFQMAKIYSSKVAKYTDNIIICSHDKSDMDLDYKNSIFIDDNASVLDKLYDAGVTSDRLLKICRPDGKYSKISTKFKAKEYNNLIEIKMEDLI